MAETYLCIDYSGSTGNCASYWEYVSGVLNKTSKPKIIFWDNQAKITSIIEAQSIIKRKLGNGGTCPSCLVNLLPAKSNIVIITDGQVDQGEVTRCDQLLNNREFNSVDVHFYNTGGAMNLSVSTPFTRKTKYNIYLDGRPFTNGSSYESINLRQYFDNPKKFIDEADMILRQIVMQNLGRVNQKLRDELLELQKNLLKFLSIQASKGNDYSMIRKNLEQHDLPKAITQLQAIFAKVDQELPKKVESIIQEMIKQCSGSNDFSFNVLQPGRITRSETVKQVTTEELPTTENYTGHFECPIALDTDLPVCLIKKGEPIFNNIEIGYLNALLTNPLLTLLDDKLVAALKSRIDHPIGLNAAKTMFSRSNDGCDCDGYDSDDDYSDDSMKSPLTRSPISSALTFGDDLQHDKANNYTLADLFFGKKLVGLPEMWLSVVYFTMQKMQYLSDDTNFMKTFQTYLMNRMKKYNTNITLSGLPIEPLVKAPIDIAVWYCIMSPYLNTTEDEGRNRLRAFGATGKYLIQLMDMFNYPYNRKQTLKLMSMYKAFAWMMNEEKANTQWRNLLRAQYQNSLVVDGTVVLLDGPAHSQPPLPDFSVMDSDKLTLGELLTLESLVDRSKATNSVLLENILETVIPLPKYNYGYSETTDKNPTKICPNTLRPYVIDIKDRIHWKLCSEKMYGPLDKQLSTYNYFVKYLHENNHYPTKSQFIKYMASKQMNKENDPKDTLPAQVTQFVDELFEEYETILGHGFTKVSPAEFKRITFESRSEINRKAMEGR